MLRKIPPGPKPSGGIKMQQNGGDGLWKYAMILENSLCAHNKYHAWDENLTLTNKPIKDTLAA